MTEHLLDIRVERKTFATTTVLKHIHLRLKPRETVNLLGPGTRRATGSPCAIDATRCSPASKPSR